MDVAAFSRYSAPMTPLRRNPAQWLFTGFVALLLAPLIAQGLDRPLASLFHAKPNGISATVAALGVALFGCFVAAIRENVKPGVLFAATNLATIGIGFGFGLHGPGFGALVVVASCTTALAHRFLAELPPAIDGILTRHWKLSACYIVMALLTIVQVARVSVFMGDPTRTDLQIVPGVKFVETHSCLTAYVRGYELARDVVDNLYLAERWPNTVEPLVRPETPFSPFDIDSYFYPPPFLLLAGFLAPFRGDFLAQRAAWFGVNGLLVAIAFWLGARELGGPRWHRPLLLAPLLFGSLPVLFLLQIGNAQTFVVIVAVLSMLAFERDKHALGGLGLALATIAKISPGILGLTLIAQKRWRAVLWTGGFGVLLVLLSLVPFGTNPLVSWVRYALPRVSSGQAFMEILAHQPSIAFNFAPSGTAFKLSRLWGVDIGDPWPIARLINHIVTLGAMVLAVLVGLRQAKPITGALTSRALSWMALLFVTALRSPYAPSYVGFSLLWGMTFLATEVENRRQGVLLVLLYIAATISAPLPPAQLAILMTIPQMTMIVLSLWLILRRRG